MLLQVLEKHSVKFLKMAGQYDVPLLMLKADVTNLLLSRVTKDTVLSMIIAAHSYNAPDLKSAAIDFILKNKLEEKSLTSGYLPRWVTRMFSSTSSRLCSRSKLVNIRILFLIHWLKVDLLL